MNRISKKQWIVLCLVSLIVIAILIVVLAPETLPQAEGQRLEPLLKQNDVIIIFNPGGWGDASLAQSTDFTPILDGIQTSLKEIGYSSVVVPYTRTPSGFFGRVSDAKELMNSFEYLSQVQAKDLAYLAHQYPQKWIILTGYSNGGGLTERTMAIMGNQPHIIAMVAGVPFWFKAYSQPNILILDNQGKDVMASGDIKSIVIALIEAPFKWIRAKFTGQKLSFSLAFQPEGHYYPWSSPEVGLPVVHFIENQFKVRNTSAGPQK
jgi:hypothetical protein